MGNYRNKCVLNWRGGKITIPFQPTTNVPVFYTASSSQIYCAFAPTFEAMEALYFQREKVLEYPGQINLMDNISWFLRNSLRRRTSIMTKRYQLMREFQRTTKQ
jgi:hypothetical protein